MSTVRGDLAVREWPAGEPLRDELPVGPPSADPAAGSGVSWRPAGLSADGLGWIGAHGGAGASTLTRLVGGTDIGCRWPDAGIREPANVMVAGRTNLDGLRAVSRALRALKEGRHPAGMRLLGVVLMADVPGALPGALLARVRMLRSIAPVHRVPWIPELRLGEMPKRLPAQLSRLSGIADVQPGPHGGGR